METAIRWSPSSDIKEQRFLLVDVIGHNFRHCRVESYNGKELKYQTLCGNRRVPAFRAFDWSTHNESIVAVGDWSGSATVIRLDDVQTTPITLSPKQQRLCNAVAFSKTGLLATGLEKVRNDFCLYIWDVSHRLSESTSPITSPGKSPSEPMRKLSSSEAITSIRFFQGQPDTFVAGVKGACIRMYDLRENGGNPALQYQTLSVQNLSIDPLDENYFASAITQKDTTIHIWDRRFGLPSSTASLGLGTSQSAAISPVLEYKNAFESSGTVQPSIWSLRYCKGQSGHLGALASNGDFRVFETKQSFTFESRPSHNQGYYLQDQPEHQLCTRNIHHVELPYRTGSDRQENARIVSFDFTNLAGPKGMPSAITLRGTGSVEIQELHRRPSAYALSSTGQLVGRSMGATSESKDSINIGSLAQLGLFHIKPSRDVHPLPVASKPLESGIPHQSNGDNVHNPENGRLSSRKKHEKWIERQYIDQIPSVDAALATLTLDHQRCVQGYLFDCRKNMQIVAGDAWLRETWDWVERAKQFAIDERFVIRGIDLSYLGVCNIWNIDIGSEKAARISGTSETTEILYAVEAVCRSLDLPDLTSTESSLPAHRRLSLYICGYGLPGKELDNVFNDLIDQGQNSKAAFMALAHNDSKQALSALRTNSTSANRELALALAGFLKGVPDDTWEETIENIAASLTDPYACAILAFVRIGSWHDVLRETSLPLKCRIGVALMYLADDELTTYISNTTDECTTHGDIEGLVLTGLSEKAVPLLQNYILKYHDLQTAILLISHTSPRYFSSPLVDTWRSEYRARLNTYRLFIPRVRFDTQATKLSVTSNGKPTLTPLARQVSVKCNNCEQALDRNPAHTSASAPPPTSSATDNKDKDPFALDAKWGTACPKCGKHLPRCVICMLWLGMPDPYTKGGAHANARTLEKMGGLETGKGEKGKYLMKDLISVCRGCWHMMHVGHVDEWFGMHRTCPVPGCECACGERDGESGGTNGR
ncbi:MAG: hypothetical protein Q9200_000393 [Gallowayella weberi]